MSNTPLTPELIDLTRQLANAFALSQKVVSARARISLFYQDSEATDLFRKVNEYGEELRNKDMAGMPPTDEEIAKFDSLRQNVVDHPLCKGFLDARQELDELLATVNQYLVLAINKGGVPTDEEVAESMKPQQHTCSCGGNCQNDCGDCHGECSCHQEQD